jgi:GxxExxY protein
MKRLSDEIERLATSIVDCAFKVHSTLGPGLLESVYQSCMVRELESRNISVEQQVAVPIAYGGMRLESGLRLDLLVQDQIVLELKAVTKMLPVYDAQLLTYLKLADRELGFLINFNVPLIKDGIKRLIR